MDCNHLFKKTKVICTIGPASENRETLAKLAQAGMNICRLNFSHGSYEEHGERIRLIREVSDQTGINLAVALDTKGPEIRLGNFANDTEEYEIGETVYLTKEEILGTDLFLYNRVPGTIWGASREFFSSPRLDNLQSVYSSVRAFLDIPDPESISVCCVFDAEEVGSTAKQGADSTFLEDTLTRICLDVFGSAERYPMMIAGSFMLSADNAHAVHPHHTDKADPTNRPYMNHGPVLKFNACQKYTTDSVSGAVFKEVCRRADVPCQIYINHSDIPGGSTLGNISNRHVSLPTADIGCAQLAMHSPYETAGTKDTWYMLQAMKMFYQTRIQVQGSQVLFQ